MPTTIAEFRNAGIPSRRTRWDEIEEFCRNDGWKEFRETDHRFFQKTLVDGTVLETHSSFASAKTMSPGRLKAILRYQLKVTEHQFWEVLRTAKASRPAAVSMTPEVAHPAYVVRVLKQELHNTEEEIALLSPNEARRLVEAHWGRERRK